MDSPRRSVLFIKSRSVSGVVRANLSVWKSKSPRLLLSGGVKFGNVGIMLEVFRGTLSCFRPGDAESKVADVEREA